MDNDYIRNFPATENSIACMGPLFFRWNIYSLLNFNCYFKIAKTQIIATGYGRNITNIVKCLGSHLRR